MPARVLRIMQEIDALLSIYHVPETVPDPLARESQPSHRLQLILALDSFVTPRFYRRGS
jgi:hypothetical protein